MDFRSVIARIATIAAIILAAIVTLYGAFLLIVGQAFGGYSQQGTGPLVPVYSFIPNPAGLIPLVGGFLTLTGILMGNAWLKWIGFTISAVFSVLFLFGIGGVLLPLTPLLLLMLVVKSIFERALRRSRMKT